MKILERFFEHLQNKVKKHLKHVVLEKNTKNSLDRISREWMNVLKNERMENNQKWRKKMNRTWKYKKQWMDNKNICDKDRGKSWKRQTKNTVYETDRWIYRKTTHKVLKVDVMDRERVEVHQSRWTNLKIVKKKKITE